MPTGPTLAPRPFEKARALCIGVSRYLHLSPLPEAVGNGASELARILSDPNLGGYPPGQVLCLREDAASRERILEELAILADLVATEATLGGEESTVLIYFAGHGCRSDGESYLLTAATDPRDLPATAISGRELTAALAAIPSCRLLLLLDCCHGGGVGAALPGPEESFYQRLVAQAGKVVLTASRPDELSMLPPTGDLPSHFSRHLFSALRGGLKGWQGTLRVCDLFEYLQSRVTNDQPDQHPVFHGRMENNFPFALYLGGRREAGQSQGFPYDAYLSYVDREPDRAWVWRALVPRLEAAALKVSVAGDADDPGAFRVVAAQRGIEEARRTVVVLSRAYLQERALPFVDALAQSIGMEEGRGRVVPVSFEDFEQSRLPPRLRCLVGLNLAHPDPGRRARNWSRLVQNLGQPLPDLSSPVS